MDTTVHKITKEGKPRWYAEIKQRGQDDSIPALRGSFYVIICNADGWNDNPIRLESGRILYDFPERVPAYAKKLVKKAFEWISAQKPPAPERPPHYIAMAGMRGYLPNYCEVYYDPGDAAEDLANMHDLTPEDQAILAEKLYLGLPSEAGNEYAEIQICHCETPEIHSDN